MTNDLIKIENGCIQPNIEYKILNGSITYNNVTYNAGDVFIGIDNFPYYDETIITDLTPDMTSNTAPSGECIGDGVYRNSVTYAYWKAFNKSLYDNNDAWISKETVDKAFPHWIGYKFDDCVVCNKFIVQSRILNYSTAPKKIKIEASNNAIDWVELYKFNEYYFPDKAFRKCYKFNNNIPYQYYRLLIEEGFSTTYTSVGELTMLHEEDSNIFITNASKIKKVTAEYDNQNEIYKTTNKFNTLATEYEVEPYSGIYKEQTQFKEIGIELPTSKEYGEVLRVSNIRMFSKPLTGNQKRNEQNN